MKNKQEHLETCLYNSDMTFVWQTIKISISSERVIFRDIFVYSYMSVITTNEKRGHKSEGDLRGIHI